ncbi:MAG: hypothetical protein A3J58_03560 [Candidatus Sungbacteria bacterium RIFCSPHIGHO2_02_FULL_52_23]|uniref:DDH domain-containing protein n=1 Tax=Candidatus Sungbacteria bacterium RIFCSPHIGHO2_02_FULL_52_23 TaxID=1802274 RepID=A0A1G2KVH9_9BACT|nr:MAG: hypothetical protein A3J58_03560 [Candidatus Sungbacteria bacterium RIFCSPHIGHO2_02_FULL_52_23]
MDTELAKAKELLAKSEHIALLLPEKPGVDCLAAAEAIAHALDARGKHVGFLPSTHQEASETAGFPETFGTVLNPTPLTREFIISIATSQVPVAELRYEKHDDRIEIILSPKATPIREDSFSFREGKVQCDCLITIGIPDIEAISARSGVAPEFFTETPIIAIGNDAAHKKYGEINLVSSAETPLSEIAYSFATRAIGTKPDAANATLLLAGILRHTDLFRSPVGKETHTAASELLSFGADARRARAIARGSRPFALMQLIARAQVRSKEDSTGASVLWSFLTAEDFEKTGRSPADATDVLRAVRDVFGERRASVLLYQDPQMKRVHAAVLADTALLAALSAREPGSPQDASLLLVGDFENFISAEERLSALLREIL